MTEQLPSCKLSSQIYPESGLPNKDLALTVVSACWKTPLCNCHTQTCMQWFNKNQKCSPIFTQNLHPLLAP